MEAHHRHTINGGPDEHTIDSTGAPVIGIIRTEDAGSVLVLVGASQCTRADAGLRGGQPLVAKPAALRHFWSPVSRLPAASPTSIGTVFRTAVDAMQAVLERRALPREPAPVMRGGL
jgi:hypothetical protein